MTNKRIQLSTNVDGQNVNVYPVTKSEFVEFSDGKTLNDKLNNMDGNHEHGLATPAKDGFMSKEDKAKLDGVNNYTHPSTHAATMITEDATHRFVTDAEKTKWDNKANTTMASKTNAGLMSASDKQRIDGLNAEFKTRDDKITKNTEDIKSWNDEMINKEYQYFNGQDITIDNSIVSKTTDMVIKGSTLANISPTGVANCNNVNDFNHNYQEVQVIQGDGFIQCTQPSTGKYNILGYDSSMLKPLTNYIHIADVEIVSNESNEDCKFHFGYMDKKKEVFINSGRGIISIVSKTKESVIGGNKSWIGIMLGTDSSISKNRSFKVYNIASYEITEEEASKEINELLEKYPIKCEGIKSFGQQEDKISILSHGKNILTTSEFKDLDSYGKKVTILNSNSINIKDANLGSWKSYSHDYILKPNTDYIVHCQNVVIREGKAGIIPTYSTGEGIRGVTEGTNTNGYVAKFNTGSRTDIKIRFQYAWSTPTKGDIDFIGIQLEEGTTPTTFEPYKENKKNILLSRYGFNEGLRRLNSTVYDELNDVRDMAIKRVGKHTFTGNETSIVKWVTVTDENFVGFCITNDDIPNLTSNRSLVICNNFPSTDGVFNKRNMYIAGNRANICIEKNALATPDIEGFKIWLKANPTTIYYELAEPVIIPFDKDINLKTFNERTYITSDNIIKGDLSFTVPMNTAANLENNTTRLNDIESYIDDNKNNINKISKLEEGAVTSSLNIIDLQKEIINDNNYTHYEGSNISINNLSKDSRTSNMIIKGKTYQNLAANVLIKRTLEDTGIIYKTIPVVAKNNTEYTLILDVTKNTTTQDTPYWGIYLDAYRVSNTIAQENTKTGICKAGFIGRKSLKFTSKPDGLIENMSIGMHSDYGAPYEFEAKAILLEGDWTNKELPLNYFEGIKSSGELENNNIKILSCGKNLFNPKEFITGERNGVTYVVDNDCIILNGKTKVSDVELISFDNYINIDIDKRYKISYKKISGSINNDDIRLACKNGSNWIISPANNKNVATITNSISKKLERIRFFVPENTVFNNFKICIQLEEQQGTNTEYEPYLSNLKSILVKEPLRGINNICDVMYQQNMTIKINRNIANFNFKGNETEWQLQSINDHEIANFRMPLNNVKGRNALCDKLIQQSTVIAETTGEGFHVSEGNGIYIRIRKTTASTIDQFKTWLKNNPINIVCDLINPVTEIVGDCLDINFNIYKNKTHIKCLNSISSELNFVIPNNLSTQIKENTNHINKNSNSLNLLDNKASKLESAQLSTALNVLELQKHTSMLDNGEISEYRNYIGTYVECDNTLDSLTESMTIKGKTLQNLIQFEKCIDENFLYEYGYIINKHALDDTPWESKPILSSLIQPNKTYTMIVKNLSDFSIRAEASINNSVYFNEQNILSGETRKAFILTNSEVNGLKCKVFSNEKNKSNAKAKFMLLEGDWVNNNNKPNYFEGIKGIGDKEKDKYVINLLSHNKNFIKNNFNILLEPYQSNNSPIIECNKIPAGTVFFSAYDENGQIINTPNIAIWFKDEDKNNIDWWSFGGVREIQLTKDAKFLRVFTNDKLTEKININSITISIVPHKKNETPETDHRKIFLKEPLQDNEFLYEDNQQVKVYRTKKQYIFTGNEEWYVDGVTNSYGFRRFYTPKIPIDKNPIVRDICDKLPALQKNSQYDKNGITRSGVGYFEINIKVSDIGGENPENLKNWLKANPVTIIYYLTEPIIENIDSIDINVNTYKDKTYITTDNEIQGELEFKTQNNFGAIMKNVNRCISKIFNSLNNILNIKGE